jgi:hypothetical protein
MDEKRRYGFCTGHGGWVPRDEMLGIHVHVYKTRDERDVVRFRFCPDCFAEVVNRMQDMAWDGVIATEKDLEPDAHGNLPSRDEVRRRIRHGSEWMDHRQEGGS